MNDDSMLSVLESAGLSDLVGAARRTANHLDNESFVAVGTLKNAAHLEALAGRALTLAVRQARAEGMTWQRIGDLLGVTRSAAHQRFSKLV